MKILPFVGFLAIELATAETLVLENTSLSRTLSIERGYLETTQITNKRAGTTLTPEACPEFELRLSQGTDKVGTDFTLDSTDFAVTRVLRREANHVVVELHSELHGVTVVAHYTLNETDFFMRKQLVITSSKPVCLERIDVEVLSIADAVQPYTIKKITSKAAAQWKPGLGQPLFTTKSGSFWGIEFPAAWNHLDERELRCGYQHGRMLEPGKSHETYQAVAGVSDDPAFVSEAFYDYIETIRIRPLRLQTQYNSWFDYGRSINEEQFLTSVQKVYNELCVKRNVPPLKAYVIDDGWQDSTANSDWTDTVWTLNDKFSPNFKRSRQGVADARSNLGLWLSPGCNFNARPIVPRLRQKGWGGLSNYMSLADTPYMELLEERMVGLARDKVQYFKLDGCFGHLNTRDFDIDGAANGVPTMPQLGTSGWRSDDKRLNDSKYDELKTYYLVVGTERLMKIFQRMGQVNPEVYIVISNGAYLSPWWLMHVDAVWMINAGDAAGGANRTQELVYRDGVYHNIYSKERTHFPMNSLFNHEPKKRKSHETKDTFRHYLYMNMSRGTGFVELYLKTFALQDFDWDVLAEGMLWVHDVFPTFKRSRMHGGDPNKNEVYGYTAWLERRGYLSIHNPAQHEQSHQVTLDRSFGLLPGRNTYQLSSPLADSLKGLKREYAYGDKIDFNLKPGEIRILCFDPEPRDWTQLIALQTRTEADYVPGSPNPPARGISLKGHPVIGIWKYGSHTREFTEDGQCILRKGQNEIWRKPCTSIKDNTVIVEGRYEHQLTGDSMKIEGKYDARRR